MRIIGKGHVRFAIGGACISFLVLLSGVSSGKEIKADDTPLKTRLEWANSASSRVHNVEWSSGFKARYWSSEWANFDRFIFALLLELAPNVAWKGYKKLSKPKDIKKLITGLHPPDAKLKIDFDGKFLCSSFTCVPFMNTAHPQWRCMFFDNNNFVSTIAKSEGILDRGAKNNSMLRGFYCKNAVDITP